MAKKTANTNSKTFLEKWQAQLGAILFFIGIGFWAGNVYSGYQYKIQILDLKQQHNREITELETKNTDCKIQDQQKQIDGILKFVKSVEESDILNSNGRREKGK